MSNAVLFDFNDEVLKSYLQKISKYQVLSQSEEKECAALARKGDEVAKKRLVQANLKLVVNIAKKHIHTSPLPLVDLIQEGNIGIMVAIDKFDHTLGYKFSTYATWWIKQAMFKAISEQSHCVRVPVYIQETLSKYKKVKSELEREYGTNVNKSVVAQKMNMSEDKIDTFLNAYTQAISLESHFELNNDSSITYSEIIEDTNQNTAREIECKELKKDIRTALSCLREREHEVITLRFGLEDEAKKTLEEIGNLYGVTKECIRQIEKRALMKIGSSAFSREALLAYV
ncbi:RNA polymerase primary sigma factor [Candidatus Gastranaerophilus sp. (ex Termes propinquus)]|nr:RNA polymerase primary sigma factor [Candidatus Gastranaerophilus sp. (ex Termes propinquus)]